MFFGWGVRKSLCIQFSASYSLLEGGLSLLCSLITCSMQTGFLMSHGSEAVLWLLRRKASMMLPGLLFPVQMPVWMETHLLCELSQVTSVPALLLSHHLTPTETTVLTFHLSEKQGGLIINLDIILTAGYIHNMEFYINCFEYSQPVGSSGQNLLFELQQTHWSPFIHNDTHLP